MAQGVYVCVGVCLGLADDGGREDSDDEGERTMVYMYYEGCFVSIKKKV